MGHVERRSLRFVLVAGLFVGAAACGGGSDGGDSRIDETVPGEQVTEQEAASSSPTPIVVGNAIVDLHGPDAGVAATLYALDAGYSVAQLTVAALDGTLGADGSITGVGPLEGGQGVITAPVEGIRRSTDAPERSAEEVQREIERKLTTLETIQLLGAPLGVGGDIAYDDVFPSGSSTSDASEPELDPAAKEAAAATIGVMVSLVDVGYSLDQVVNGFIFGEAAVAIGVDRSGEENPNSFSIDGAPVAPCFTLRDATGQVIMPAGTGTNMLLASTTCGRAIRAGTISFDGIDRLRNGSEVSTTSTASSADVEVDGGSEQAQGIDGRYVGSLDNPGSIYDVEVGDNRVEVVVEGGNVTEFSLGVSGRYSACFGGYGVEDEVSCTVWLTWDMALSGGPVVISEGSTDVPVTATQVYTDCESELASECKDLDETQVEMATVRISITEETMTGSILFEGQDIGAGFAATRQ